MGRRLPCGRRLAAWPVRRATNRLPPSAFRRLARACRGRAERWPKRQRRLPAIPGRHLVTWSKCSLFPPAAPARTAILVIPRGLHWPVRPLVTYAVGAGQCARMGKFSISPWMAAHWAYNGCQPDREATCRKRCGPLRGYLPVAPPLRRDPANTHVRPCPCNAPHKCCEMRRDPANVPHPPPGSSRRRARLPDRIGTRWADGLTIWDRLFPPGKARGPLLVDLPGSWPR